MSLQEKNVSHEPLQPSAVYVKANEILDAFGKPATQKTTQVINTPWRTIEFMTQRGPDIAITQAPIVPVQIGDREYKFWLRRGATQADQRYIPTTLSVHFQLLPPGLEKTKQDTDGYVTDYWYKSEDQDELKHVKVIKSPSLPKEIEFFWFLAKHVTIQPNSVLDEAIVNVPPEVTDPLGNNTDDLLKLLEEMHKKLKTS